MQRLDIDQVNWLGNNSDDLRYGFCPDTWDSGERAAAACSRAIASTAVKVRGP